MSLNQADRVIASWEHGRHALVQLVQNDDGNRYIVKKYKFKFWRTMYREAAMTWYLSQRLEFVPKLLHVCVSSNALRLSVVPGTRLREWILEHYAPPGTRSSSSHLLQSDPVVMAALKRFRTNNDETAVSLKRAITRSYSALHALGWIHGSADPRNMLYDGNKLYIIDFDQARPSWNAVAKESPCLTRWYGIALDGVKLAQPLIQHLT
jgi:tRNA A-37 threonylcarbamoyl transferase component Bud32